MVENQSATIAHRRIDNQSARFEWRQPDSPVPRRRAGPGIPPRATLMRFEVFFINEAALRFEGFFLVSPGGTAMLLCGRDVRRTSNRAKKIYVRKPRENPKPYGLVSSTNAAHFPAGRGAGLSGKQAAAKFAKRYFVNFSNHISTNPKTSANQALLGNLN